MKSGKLDRRIEIKRPGAPTSDGYTTILGALEPYATRSANWTPVRINETFENLGREAHYGGIFIVRYDALTAAIRETDKVIFGSRTWDIISINEIGRKDGIELIVAASETDDLVGVES